jgi:Flp pilus assembly protein TadD
MLTLFEAGIAAARAQAKAGRVAVARRTLLAVLAQPELEPKQQVLAHREAAKLAVAGEQYRRARRHLRAARVLAPHDAEIHYELGRVFEDDPYGCDRRAAQRYRKAVQLNINEPKYQAALGRAMIRNRETRSGIKMLRRAANAAPTDIEVLELVTEGLRDAGRSDLAFELLSKARFLAPADSGISHLWIRSKFDRAAEYQKRQNSSRSESIVPRLRLYDKNATTRTRTDNGSRPVAHFVRLRSSRNDPA